MSKLLVISLLAGMAVVGPVRSQTNSVAGAHLRLDQAADQLEKEGQDLAKAFTNQIQSIRQAEKERESAGDTNLWFYVAVGLGVIVTFRKVAPMVAARLAARALSESEETVAAPAQPSDERPSRQSASSEQAQPWAQATTEQEARSAETEPLEEFFRTISQDLAALRKSLCELGRLVAPDEQKRLLGQLLVQMRVLRSKSNLSGVRPFWQLAGGIEGMLEQLSSGTEVLMASTLRTLANAIDLLHSLSVRGLRADLAVEPTPRLLAVDDDPVSRYAVGFAMKRFLVKPDTATEGESALALAEETSYDLIFLDVQMPGMDGFELCSRIHATARNHTTPIVFVTCQSDFDARARSSLIGGQDLIGKPFLTFELSLKALTVVLRRRLQSEAAQKSASNRTTNPSAPGRDAHTKAPELRGTVAQAFATPAATPA